MLVRSWLDALKPHFTRQPTRRQRRAAGLGGRSRHLHVEPLEDRRLMGFDPAVAYPTAAYPAGVVAADFDGDGTLDLATANYRTNNVSVRLGNPDGTFRTAQDSTTGNNPQSLAVGDFDADGKLDLVTANAGDVSVLLGNGNGTFQAPNNLVIGHHPTSIAVGDFNSDGKLDLGATSNVYSYGGGCGNPYYPCYGEGHGHYEGNVNVLLGTGGGFFAPPIVSDLGRGYHSSAVVRDFNSDGKLDLASAADGGRFDPSTVNVAFGSGTGTFGSPVAYWTGNNPSVDAGDVNADGHWDLVTGSGSGVSVFLGNGLGSFAAAQTYNAGSPLTMADFNGDGAIDIATRSWDGTVGVMLGTGSGAFKPPVTAAAGANATGIAAGDFNGDGRPDVVLANRNSDLSTLSVLINDGAWPALDAPSISITDRTVTEGHTGTVAATFTVSLSAAYNQTVTVHYATVDGGAVAGSDYQGLAGDLTFTPGQTSQDITVLVRGDRLAEFSEAFYVRLTQPANAFVADVEGAGTILDDEPSVFIESSVSNVEGNTGTTTFNFLVTLPAGYDAPVTVNFSTADLTPDEEDSYGAAATAGIDYTAQTGSVTFAPGDTSKTITVRIAGDRVPEPDELFQVNLGPSTSAHVVSGQALGVIVNDEPQINISDVTKSEGKNRATTLFTFTVTLSAAYDQSVTMSFRTTDGTATTASGDYGAKSGTLTFAPGETTKTITIEVKGDNKKEADETFYLDLFGNSLNSLFTKNRGVGTILNDD